MAARQVIDGSDGAAAACVCACVDERHLLLDDAERLNSLKEFFHPQRVWVALPDPLKRSPDFQTLTLEAGREISALKQGK